MQSKFKLDFLEYELRKSSYLVDNQKLPLWRGIKGEDELLLPSKQLDLTMNQSNNFRLRKCLIQVTLI
jgi:hypothetical protein